MDNKKSLNWITSEERRVKTENAHALQEERLTSTKLVIQQRLALYEDKMVYKLPASILEPGIY